jgi:XTP/dITP diphosphohydrolase
VSDVPNGVRVVLATANLHKAAEITAILGDILGDAVVLVPRPSAVPDVEETGVTLEDNAVLKARALVDATGLPALADDTGLEVDALGGAPGVYSARFAGPDATNTENVAKLLAALEELGADTPERRRARFRTVAALVYPDGRQVVTEGVVDGVIIAVPRGDGGFGYDSVFAATEAGGPTFGELSSEEKHRISHRGRAFRSLAVHLSAP